VGSKTSRSKLFFKGVCSLKQFHHCVNSLNISQEKIEQMTLRPPPPKNKQTFEREERKKQRRCIQGTGVKKRNKGILKAGDQFLFFCSNPTLLRPRYAAKEVRPEVYFDHGRSCLSASPSIGASSVVMETVELLSLT